MYKRIAGAEDQATLADVRAELQDRYGTPPESVLNLLAAGEIRLQCERLGIAQLDRKRTQIDQPAPPPSPTAPRPSGPQHTMLSMRRPQPPPKPVAAKVFVEMLHIRFAAASADSSQTLAPDSLARTTLDPGLLMKLVSRNAKRGAQFTQQGVLRWPLPSAKSEEVLAETRALLTALEPPPA